jgi:hypothetical protein
MRWRIFLLFIFCSSLSYAQTDISGMITCFRQGDKKDNAVAIALIKASIAAFEVGSVFKEKVMSNGSLEITLKNGNVHVLTPEELREAEAAAGFELNDCKTDKPLKYAIKCYAAMAKQRQADVPGSDYASALKYLDGEAEVSSIYTLLGLEKNIKMFRKGVYVENRCAMVVWRGKDAVFQCNGLIDKKGKERSMSVFYYGRYQVVDEWDADMNPGKI